MFAFSLGQHFKLQEPYGEIGVGWLLPRGLHFLGHRFPLFIKEGEIPIELRTFPANEK